MQCAWPDTSWALESGHTMPPLMKLTWLHALNTSVYIYYAHALLHFMWGRWWGHIRNVRIQLSHATLAWCIWNISEHLIYAHISLRTCALICNVEASGGNEKTSIPQSICAYFVVILELVVTTWKLHLPISFMHHFHCIYSRACVKCFSENDSMWSGVCKLNPQ